jgi:hypothetical protein
MAAEGTTEERFPPRLRDKYRAEAVPALMKQFAYTNHMQVPRVLKVTVNMGLGEAVSNAKIIEVVDLSRIELEAAVAPEDVGGVAIGQKARLAIAGIDEPVTARVARVNPSTQAGTRAVMVYLAVDAHPALRQGLFSTGQIDLKTTQALAVPVSAVRVDQAQPYVLAVTADRVERRTVTLGQRGEMPVDGHLEAAVELATGVADGTRVLRGVAGGVRDGAVVRMVPSPSASASVADVR